MRGVLIFLKFSYIVPAPMTTKIIALVKNNLLEIAVFFSSVLLFAFTLNPSIFHGDTTEFINAIAVSGVAHPPGYPLLLILGKIFSFLPGLPLPARLNLLSALASAFTVAVCAHSIKMLTGSRPAAALAAGLLAVSSSFWLYSEVLETFSLNALLISIFLWQSIVFVKKPSKKRALLLVFLLAINAGNHHTAALLLPILVAELWTASRKFALGWKFWISAALISASGFLPYTYIFALASNNPPINWDNAVNIKNLLRLILRKDFGTFLLAPGSLSFTPKETPLGLYFIDLFRQTFGALPILAFAGLAYLYQKKEKFIFSFLAYAFLSLGPAFAFLSRLQITSIHQKAALERFYIASYVPLSILAGVGFAFIASRIPKKLKFVSFACLLLIIPPAIAAFPYANQRGNNFYENYSREIMATFPEAAVFVTTGDVSDNGTQYLQLVKKEKQNATIITLPKTVAPWYREQLEARYPELKGLISDLPQETVNNLCGRYGNTNRLFIAGEVAGLNLNGEYCTSVPKGLSVALILPKTDFDLQTYKDEQLNYFENIEKTLLNRLRPKDLRTERVLYEIAAAADRVGNFLLLRGDKEGAALFYNKAITASPYWNSSLDSLAVLDAERGELGAAAEKEREAIRRNPESPKSYFNLGILLKESGKKDEAKKALLDFLSFRPDPRLPEVEMARRALRELENDK